MASILGRHCGTWGLLVMAALPAFVLLAQAGAQSIAEDKTTVVRGVVERFTIAPKGETHGLVLDDGTEVRWPPYLGAKVKDLVARNDRVRVTGWIEAGKKKKDGPHFKAIAIANLTTNESVDLTEGPPGAPSLTVRGVVERFTIAPKGETHGLVLDDGTEVRWPPYFQDRVRTVVRVNDKVRATGWVDVGKKGDKHVKARTITNLTTDKSIDLTATALASAPAQPPAAAPSARIRALEEQIEQLRKEIESLRDKKGKDKK